MERPNFCIFATHGLTLEGRLSLMIFLAKGLVRAASDKVPIRISHGSNYD